MDYMTVSEAAEKWGISVRRVQVLCSENRIPNLTKFGKSYAIPADAVKPEDERIKSGEYIGYSQKYRKKG